MSATCALDEETIKKTEKAYCGKLVIRPDHPRWPIKTNFACGQSSRVVLRFKFHQNVLSPSRAGYVGGRNLLFLIALTISLCNSL